jgi:AcrR family transcriptional regulator
MPRTKQRTPELRDHIVRVALATLADEGVAAFTARRIADGAATSVPAVYELFGDKAGLVREVFFEGFRELRHRFDELGDTDNPRADLVRVVTTLRRFVGDNPVLAEVMFSRPFADFDPSLEERSAGTSVREFIIRRVQRAIDAGQLVGNATDLAHVVLAVAQGLAVQETAGWLGTSKASRDRRWALAIELVLSGASAT